MPRTAKQNKAPVDPAMIWTEKKLQTSIKKAALDCGYLFYHTQVSLYSARGMPDVVLCRPSTGTLMFLELKGPKGKPTEAQVTWIVALAQIPGVIAKVVYPNDLEAVYQALVTGTWPK